MRKRTVALGALVTVLLAHRATKPSASAELFGAQHSKKPSMRARFFYGFFFVGIDA